MTATIRLLPAVGFVVWAGTIVVGITALVLRAVRPDPIIRNTFGMGEAGLIAFVVLGITWATVGAVLVARRPDNVVGRWVLAVGFGYATSILASAVTFTAAAQGTTAGGQLAGVSGWLAGVGVSMGAGLYYLAIIFPTGRGHSARWDVARRGFLVVIGLTVVQLMTQPGKLFLFPSIDNPFGVGPDLRPLVGPYLAPLVAVGSALGLPLMVGAVLSRYQAAGHVERLQLRWFMSAIGLSFLSLVPVSAAGVLGAPDLGETALVVFALAGTSVPLAIGIAILRHHLYDIDRILSRSISWAAVTGTLVTVFALAVVGLQAALARVTQGQTLAVAASTLVAFGLFQPLRRWIQRLVDRRFDRARYDAERTADEFAKRVRNEVDLDAVTTDLARTCQAAVRPARADVWLRGAG